MRANLYHRKVLKYVTSTPHSNLLHGGRGLDTPQRAQEGALGSWLTLQKSHQIKLRSAINYSSASDSETISQTPCSSIPVLLLHPKAKEVLGKQQHCSPLEYFYFACIDHLSIEGSSVSISREMGMSVCVCIFNREKNELDIPNI